MSFSRPPFRIAIVVLLLFGACTEPASTSLLPSGDASFAKSSASTAPTVTATTPAEAPRDTTLDVQITGSGFDPGSVAAFTLGGVSDSRVRVNRTRYVKSTQVVANVTIAADAVASMYDVAVTTAGGKKGIGTELFAVELRGELLSGGMLAGGVSAGGDVTGWAKINSTCSAPYAGYVWHLDGSRADLPLAQGFCGASSKDMNSSGVVLGPLFNAAGSTPALWTPTASGYVVQVLSAPSDGARLTAMALNDAGDVVGWAGSARLYWRSTNTEWLPVGAPIGATACQLRGINNLGAIVGMCSIGGAAYEGYYWADHNASPITLPRPTPSGDVWPSAINDGGAIVGWVASAPNLAVRWTPSGTGFTPSVLPDLGAGASAAAIASDGSAVGAIYHGRGFPRPALWSADGRLTLLETHNGADGEAEKVAFTSVGLVIAGYQNLSGKQTMRWRAQP
jgi:hypothetical protein